MNDGQNWKLPALPHDFVENIDRALEAVAVEGVLEFIPYFMQATHEIGNFSPVRCSIIQTYCTLKTK